MGLNKIVDKKMRIYMVVNKYLKCKKFLSLSQIPVVKCYGDSEWKKSQRILVSE